MDFDYAINGLLAASVRLVGSAWIVIAVAVAIWLRRRAALDRTLDALVNDAAAEDRRRGWEDRNDPQTDARLGVGPSEIWIDRDDRNRRGWLMVHAVLFGLTGTAMLALHSTASWLAAGLVGVHGVYYLARERAVRRAPSREARVLARPGLPSVAMGWASLLASELVWIADFRHVVF